MINLGNTKLILQPGTRINYLGEEHTITDVSYILGEGYATASTGELHYLLRDKDLEPFGWVKASLIEHPQLDLFYDQDDKSPELLERGYNMVAWSDGLPDLPDNSKLPEIVTMLMAIQYHKEKDYGSSWKARGEYRSILPNIDRKYDRLDKMTNDEIAGTLRSLAEQEELLKDDYEFYVQEVGESKIDAIADFTNYGLLYMTYVRDNFPNVFRCWVEKNVPKYLAEKIPFL